jgi:hypothetical protein|tara:strand:+ start:544 stop:759 length:216 start_codon:yes stop_codon:yes gene_type:complete
MIHWAFQRGVLSSFAEVESAANGEQYSPSLVQVTVATWTPPIHHLYDTVEDLANLTNSAIACHPSPCSFDP